jgi:3-hydroxyacyl-CoA dehydrogenase
MNSGEGRQVAVIGAGLIGRSWAIVFAAAGWNVRITDPDNVVLDAAPSLIRQSLTELSEYGLVENPHDAAARVTTAADMADAVENATIVQENGPEDVEVKRRIFADLDRLSPPEAILASSSSAIPASQFTEGLPGRHRCLVAHPVNPPHLIPVVELCGAPWTSAEVIATAREIFADIGQTPVTINSEIEGFVLNRLQGALLAEAFRLVGDQIISPQDLDRTVKDGLGLRWSFMGPLQTIDLNAPGGIADYCKRYTGFYRRLSETPAPPEVWDAPNVERILQAWGDGHDTEARASQSAWRNGRLAALRAHKLAASKG